MTALGHALADHRTQHDGCDRHCNAYLDIACHYTEPRKRWDGPVAARTILTIREDP